jgi:TatD DNase family protein
MIDAHCHLEQKEFEGILDEVIEKSKKVLKGIITCCAHPDDFEFTLSLVEKYKNFVFCTVGIHPECIKEVSEKQKDEFFGLIKRNRDKIIGIGEVGLDYDWVKEETWKKKQRELFVEFINFAKEIKKPLVVHSRAAYEESVKILEQEDAKNVLLHLFGGRHLIDRVMENDWYISVGPILLRSKKHKKIVKKTPLEKIMLETDSPWFPIDDKIGYPWNVKFVAEKICEIKKIKFEEIDKITDENVKRFFEL